MREMTLTVNEDPPEAFTAAFCFHSAFAFGLGVDDAVILAGPALQLGCSGGAAVVIALCLAVDGGGKGLGS
jgi:hypothetical protein